jgi:hypothetical protein
MPLKSLPAFAGGHARSSCKTGSCRPVLNRITDPARNYRDEGARGGRNFLSIPAITT